MNDLFPASAPSGLSLRENLVGRDEEAALIAAIDGAGLAPFRFQGWVGKRLTASFGWHYDFDRAALPLAPRSAYHLSGEARHDWEHSIAPSETRRWSITFRSLSARGRRAESRSEVVPA